MVPDLLPPDQGQTGEGGAGTVGEVLGALFEAAGGGRKSGTDVNSSTDSNSV